MSFSLGSVGLAVAAGINVFSPFIFVLNAPGPFRYGELSLPGQVGVVIELLATIAVLYGLEPSLRNSRGSVRCRCGAAGGQPIRVGAPRASMLTD